MDTLVRNFPAGSNSEPSTGRAGERIPLAMETGCDMKTTKIRDVTITTDDDTHVVRTLEKLDAVLDSVHQAGRPVWVELVVDDDPDAHPDDVVGLQIGLGAEYSTLAFYDDKPPHRYGSVGTLPMPDDAEVFVMAGVPTAMEPDSAVSLDEARQTAREFAASGRRPECVTWKSAV